MATDGREESSQFASALSRLKQHGSALLVVGNVAPEIHQIACRLLAGDPSTHRQRLFVVTGKSTSAVRTVAGGGSKHTNRLIEYTTTHRCDTVRHSNGIAHGSNDTDRKSNDTDRKSNDTAYSPTEGTLEAHTTVDSATSFTAALVHDIHTIERDAAPLRPGELRICIDSLFPLIEASGREATFRAVHYAAVAAQRRNGMVHVHLPVDRSTEAASLFEPLADAVVELRAVDGAPQHRWHLQDAGVSSDWIDV